MAQATHVRVADSVALFFDKLQGVIANSLRDAPGGFTPAETEKLRLVLWWFQWESTCLLKWADVRNATEYSTTIVMLNDMLVRVIGTWSDADFYALIVKAINAGNAALQAARDVTKELPKVLQNLIVVNLQLSGALPPGSGANIWDRLWMYINANLSTTDDHTQLPNTAVLLPLTWISDYNIFYETLWAITSYFRSDIKYTYKGKTYLVYLEPASNSVDSAVPDIGGAHYDPARALVFGRELPPNDFITPSQRRGAILLLWVSIRPDTVIDDAASVDISAAVRSPSSITTLESSVAHRLRINKAKITNALQWRNDVSIYNIAGQEMGHIAEGNSNETMDDNVGCVVIDSALYYPTTSVLLKSNDSALLVYAPVVALTGIVKDGVHLRDIVFSSTPVV